MSFARPTLTTLIARVRADIDGRLPGADSRLSRSLLDVLARVHAGASDGLYGYLGSIARDVMPDTADTEHLDRWSTIWGVARKAATAAAGSVALTGYDGAVVAAGTVLLRADGAQFVVQAQTAIAGGAATVAVIAVDAGAASDTDAGVALAFASPAAGVAAQAIVGPSGIGGGADEESDPALLARLLARIQSPPNGGSEADYVAWALAQPEVTRAYTFPAWLGAGSIGVAVLMDGRVDIFPTADDCAAIQAAIDVARPVTANLVVFPPVPAPVAFAIAVTPSTAATKAAVMAELTDLFARESSPGATILISHVREAISVAAGVTDYTLPYPAANIVSVAPAMPTVGAVNWLD